MRRPTILGSCSDSERTPRRVRWPGGKERIFGPLEANRYHVLAWSAALWDESLPWLGCLGRACAAP